jgi:hypothetical protein
MSDLLTADLRACRRTSLLMRSVASFAWLGHRLAFAFAGALVAATGCGGGPADKLEGKWVGERPPG